MRTLSFLLILICFSCSTSKPESEQSLLSPYLYNNGFNAYFKETFKVSIDNLNSNILIVIPFESCAPCVDTSLYELNHAYCSDCSVIWVGVPKDSIMNHRVHLINNKFNTYSDPAFKLFEYETNIGSPTILFKENGIVKNYFELSFANWNIAKKILNWN